MDNRLLPTVPLNYQQHRNRDPGLRWEFFLKICTTCTTKTLVRITNQEEGLTPIMKCGLGLEATQFGYDVATETYSDNRLLRKTVERLLP